MRTTLLFIPLMAAATLYSSDAAACAMAPIEEMVVAEQAEAPTLEDLFAEIDNAIPVDAVEEAAEAPIADAEVDEPELDLKDGKQVS
ncbi:MAG: hypothetical protein AAFV53_06785 [Myxococcota bacterium]